MTEADAFVTSFTGAVITLDQTIFYALSVGQESDTGTIGGYPVLAAEKAGKQLHHRQTAGHDLTPDQQVKVRIDWPRCNQLMCIHFVAEVILDWVHALVPGIAQVGAHVSDSKSQIDFITDDNISGLFPELIKQASDLIAPDFPIISDYSDRDAQKRDWEVNGFVRVPCG